MVSFSYSVEAAPGDAPVPLATEKEALQYLSDRAVIDLKNVQGLDRTPQRSWRAPSAHQHNVLSMPLMDSTTEIQLAGDKSTPERRLLMLVVEHHYKRMRGYTEQIAVQISPWRLGKNVASRMRLWAGMQAQQAREDREYGYASTYQALEFTMATLQGVFATGEKLAAEARDAVRVTVYQAATEWLRAQGWL